MNTYAYVGGNPLRFIDPIGLVVNVLIGGNHWYGHAATQIDGQVFSNGRYPVSGRPTESGGLVGPNVLTVQSTSSYLASHPNATSYTLNLSADQEANLLQYYQDLINNSEKHPSRSSWHILPNDYSFVGNNCSSTVVDGLQSVLPWYQSMSLPGVSTPQTLEINLILSPFLVQ